MFCLLPFLFACAAVPQSPVAEPIVAETVEPETPSQPSAPVFTVTSVRRECGPNDGPLIRVDAETGSGLDLQLDLPDRLTPGPHEAQIWREKDRALTGATSTQATVLDYTNEHLKAEVTLPSPDGQTTTLQIDSDIRNFAHDCG